jgi:hypothetical protein
MKEVVQNLDEAAEEALRTIIGKLNVGFYFPEAWIPVAREGFEVGSLSIPTGKDNFVVVTCEWGDTLEDYLDIYYLQVSVDDRPRDIAASRDENGPSGWGFDHVTMLETYDWTIIEKISIYELLTAGPHESVRCDRAILFKYAKGEVLVSTGRTLPGRFEINYKPNVIADTLATFELRKEITNDAALQLGLSEKAKLQSAWSAFKAKPRKSLTKA